MSTKRTNIRIIMLSEGKQSLWVRMKWFHVCEVSVELEAPCISHHPLLCNLRSGASEYRRDLHRHKLFLPLLNFTARRSNQSILKEVSPEYSVEGLMLKLKCQYFGHLMRRADSFEKTLMLGKVEGRRRGDDRGWGGWVASSTQGTWVWASSGRWCRTGKSGVLQSMGSQRVGQDWATEHDKLHIDGVVPFSSALTWCEASGELQSFHL